jgi:hypothetical protein
VKSVFIVPVGGTRCVTWSIDRILQIHARITWGVVLILAIFFIFFLLCLTYMTTTIHAFFQCSTGGGMTQSLVDGVPTRRLMDDPERWSSGLFYDWTHGLADAIHHAGKDNASVHTLVRVEVCGV